MGTKPRFEKAQVTGYAALRGAVRGQMARGAYKDALAQLVQLVKVMPEEAGLLDDMAGCYWHLGDHRTALHLTEIVARDLGRDAAAWGKLGRWRCRLAICPRQRPRSRRF
ncbi:hypothetical protein EI983_01650 [Roseovarius faecimaris]|uniref:Tetratricopeptide repeat protein n=1 Tax=Roseovarius faecimaris TaxID=2494550 RepID=A0A6I6IPB1_9RHOB|nr:hypothetical protein [Roseovarius faecimaris]QGX97046.1 hypothetical protein EI983_01650 [Roseovarius faecimaris]